MQQGLAGLTARDIKLFVDAGYHTVESIAYTYVSYTRLLLRLNSYQTPLRQIRTNTAGLFQIKASAGADQGYLGAKGDQGLGGR